LSTGEVELMWSPFFRVKGRAFIQGNNRDRLPLINLWATLTKPQDVEKVKEGLL